MSKLTLENYTDLSLWPDWATHVLTTGGLWAEYEMDSDLTGSLKFVKTKNGGFVDDLSDIPYHISNSSWIILASRADLEAKQISEPIGQKYDQGKAMMSLIPPLAELSVADVLTFGAEKYAPENWRKVDNAHARYMDAAKRHINAYQRGETHDQESGLPHLSHAICCLMFMQELDLEKEMEDEKTP